MKHLNLREPICGFRRVKYIIGAAAFLVILSFTIIGVTTVVVESGQGDAVLLANESVAALPSPVGTAHAVMSRPSSIMRFTCIGFKQVSTNGVYMGRYWIISHGGQEYYVPESDVAIPANWKMTNGCHFISGRYGTFVQTEEVDAVPDYRRTPTE